MIVNSQRPPDGFALIVVMVIITVLSILAGAFAFSMKVETRLARNSGLDSEMEWLGRSGIEFARFVLANSGGPAGQNVTALNQFWASGYPSLQETNGPLEGLSLTDNELGGGRFSIRIRDLESRMNVNALNPKDPRSRILLDRALTLMGVDGGETATIGDSILDWMDADNMENLSGAETDFYLSHDPPYTAKNGPIDDLTELLLVNGMTKELFWGPAAPFHSGPSASRRASRGPELISPALPVGFVDLFTCMGLNRVNVNTAPAMVLQLVLGVDETIAQNIIRVRSGPDEAEGTEDDMPFMNPGMLMTAVPGMNPQTPMTGLNLVATQSATFEVTVDTRIGNYNRQFVALLRRDPQQVQILQFSWK